MSWSHELGAAIRALPESAWQIEREDGDAVRHWAEVPYVPSDGVAAKDRPAPPRYLALRITKKQGRLFADGGEVKHFAIVTNLPDPKGGSGLDLIRWQRGKAGTVEHAHHVLTNELAAEALPSQRFGANAAWFRLNVLLYNLLSAFKRVALPEELHHARPKRLRFVLLNGVGKVVRHARETVLRLVGEARCLRPCRCGTLHANTRYTRIQSNSLASRSDSRRQPPPTAPMARPCPPQFRVPHHIRGFGAVCIRRRATRRSASVSGVTPAAWACSSTS
ncbi:MAG: transposase, partial [Chloroflexota bacterium]